MLTQAFLRLETLSSGRPPCALCKQQQQQVRKKIAKNQTNFSLKNLKRKRTLGIFLPIVPASGKLKIRLLQGRHGLSERDRIPVRGEGAYGLMWYYILGEKAKHTTCETRNIITRGKKSLPSPYPPNSISKKRDRCLLGNPCTCYTVNFEACGCAKKKGS